MFTIIERTIVDWLEANKMPPEEDDDGEWLLHAEAGSTICLTELAHAIFEALKRKT